MSARKLSLQLGMNSGYIQHIMSGHQRLTLEVLFDICDKLHITPMEFFQPDIHDPTLYQQAMKAIGGLNEEDMKRIIDFSKRLYIED